MTQESFSLKWNNYQDSMTKAFRGLLERDYLTDVTLLSGSKAWRAHRVVLSASSPYFDNVFNGLSLWQHPVLVLNHIKPHSIQSILEYIYSGKVTIENTKLEEFMKVGDLLGVRGLATSNRVHNKPSVSASAPVQRSEPDPQQMVRITKTKRAPTDSCQNRKPKERKSSYERTRERSLTPEPPEPPGEVLNIVKEEPEDHIQLSEDTEMVVVKADPDDFRNAEPDDYERPETVPLTIRNDLMQKKDDLPQSIFGESGSCRCHFCSHQCRNKDDLTEHLKSAHMPVKHALCENCENFFHVCAIQRHKLKCQARYQSDM